MPNSRSDSTAHVVVPARWASTRLPGKPLLDIAGEPMVVRVLQSVSRALPNVDAVVATDDERIARAVEKAGWSAVLTSATCESGTDRVAEVARVSCWGDHDLVINVQGDEPLLPSSFLAAFYDFCVQGRVEMATACVPIIDHAELSNPNVVKVVRREDGSAIYFSRAALPFDRDLSIDSWQLERHRRHIGIYAYRHDVLRALTLQAPCEIEVAERLEQLRALWLGFKIEVLDWSEPPPPGVDTPSDLETVRRTFLESRA